MMAYKVGYLNMQKSKTFYRSWLSRFYVLTNVGLLYMDRPNEKTVKLYHTLDFKVVKVNDQAYDKANVFKLKTI